MGWKDQQPDSTREVSSSLGKNSSTQESEVLQFCSFESSQMWQGKIHWSYWQAMGH